MRDYLLDTCIWSDWYDPKKNKYVLQKLAKYPNVRVHVSAVTLGELQYGYDVLTQRERRELGNVCKFVSAQGPAIVEVNKHVATEYGRVRALLFERFAPREKKRRGLRPEQLRDPVTSHELGIQENDLWIVAQAVVRNMTLVSNDKLKRILEVLEDSLHIENWAAEGTS